jgi:peptidoglycan/xylan/chitin deacetylase (PgdA/CDA1 family)
MIKALLKASIFGMLGNSAVAGVRASRLRGSAAVTVLNLHRVAPDDASSYPPLDPKIFDRLLSFCKKHFEFVRFSDLGTAPTREPRRPQLILSFDDGYKDFIEYAVPIMVSHGAVANQNVIPACIERGTPPVNVLAQDFIGRAPREVIGQLELPGFEFRREGEDRLRLGMRLCNFIKNRPIVEQNEISDILLPQFGRVEEFRPTPMMSRAEVQQLASECEMGAHSFEHATMEFEEDAYVAEDARKCRRYMADLLGEACEIYAFPNGSCREGQIELVEREGFKTVLLVGERFSRSNARRHHRLSIYGDSISEVRFRALGGFQSVP